jgi:hypothetical protein
MNIKEKTRNMIFLFVEVFNSQILPQVSFAKSRKKKRKQKKKKKETTEARSKKVYF